MIAGRYDCVIPAAGYSSRMGAFKPLVNYRGRALVLHGLEQAVKVCRSVILVTGHRGDELENQVRSLEQVRIVHNPDFSEGMVRSIAAGAELVQSAWFFVAPGDMPALPATVYRTLADHSVTVDSEGANGTGRTAAIFPVLDGRRGHPVLVSSRIIPELLNCTEVPSMREFLRRYTVEEIPFPDTAVNRGMFLDIDRPEDVG